MTAAVPDPPEGDDDQQLFEALDRYVSQIHRGETTRSQVLLARPELAEYLGCLEMLDGFANQMEAAANEMPGVDRTVLTPPPEAEGEPKTNSSMLRPRFEPGQRFGKYVLEGELGRGGMGVVFKAKQTDLDRCVALKMILSDRLATDDEIRRFYLEAKSAGKLRHPNIVGIHEVGELDGQHYFAMDCVDGESLAERLEGDRLTREESVRCLAQIARAVDYLHRHDIVHRDLKPSNILLDDRNVPYVTDFGLAKQTLRESGRNTRTGTIIGTASYMSPEQAAGATALVTARSDIYSLGAILYEMLCGRPPFQEATLLDTLREVLEGEPPEPRRLDRTIPVELELICLKCLDRDPAARYDSAAELATDLEAYLVGSPIAATPAPLTKEVRRWARREPALASRLSALLVVALITQISYWFWGVDWPYHRRVMLLFGVWAGAAWVFQAVSNRIRGSESWLPFAWTALDVGMLTHLLSFLVPPIGPLLVGYPLLISSSAMFFRVRFVVWTTMLCSLGIMVLSLMRHEEFGPVQYPIIIVGALFVIGGTIAYQVFRTRRLSHHYERQHA